MKKWNTPNVEELNINETANGIFNADFESFILFNKKSETPDEKDDVEKLS